MVQPVPTAGSNGAAHRQQIASALNALIAALQGTDEPNIATNTAAIAALQNNEQILQIARAEVTAVATGTTTMPGADNVPQNTNGDQYMSLTVTPKSATSKLRVEIVAHLTNSGGAVFMWGALFQDSTAAALASAVAGTPSAGSPAQVTLRHEISSVSTSPTTFKFRAGAVTAGTTTFNGSGGLRWGGGTLVSSIKVTEVTP